MDATTPTPLFFQTKKVEGKLIAAGEENSLGLLQVTVGIKNIFGFLFYLSYYYYDSD